MTSATSAGPAGISRAVITGAWAVLGATCATGVWATLNGIYGAVQGASPAWFPAAFVVGLYFGGFVALLLLVPYWALLFGYVILLARRPAIESNTRQFLLVAFYLSIPVATVVFVSFLDPWSPLGPFWDETLIAGPMALASTWSGIVIPRLVIPSMRPGSWLAA